MATSMTMRGEPLINDALEHPIINYNDYQKNLQSLGIAPSPGNSDSMTGMVAVCLFFIESNGSIDPNTYTWSSTDQQNTINRAISGLSWWASQAPSYGASVSFSVYYYSSTSSVTQQGYEPILHTSNDDALWINQIMANLGFTSGDKHSRVTAFNTWFKGYYGTNWAYSVFIGYNPSPAPDRFTNDYFAYAYMGGPYTQMLFRNNGWGETNFGLVLTHETGHIFWACDEYYQAGYGGCTFCGACAPSGPRPTVENGNCEYCNSSSVPCMMRSNSYQLCFFTPLQIGWTSAYTYTVTPSAGAGGSISPSTPQTVNLGSTVTFTVTPDTGYHIDTVTGCGGALTGNTYTTGPITADCDVTATFEIDCNVEDIAISPNPLNLKKNTSEPVTVTLTGTGGCGVEGETVTAKVTKGSKRISVSPASPVTDEDGEATFTITAKKKTGKAKVSFEAGAVKKTLTVAVTKK